MYLQQLVGFDVDDVDSKKKPVVLDGVVDLLLVLLGVVDGQHTAPVLEEDAED